jgi:beta-galactosidase
VLTPSVEVWSNASAVTPVAFSVALAVVSPAGAVVATASGAGAAPGGGAVTTWAPAAPLALPGAALWHLVDAPLKPALYTLVTTLSVGGAVVQTHNTTFGVRATRWSADTGFWLNGVNTKIKGTANHQDYMAVGVAVPDHIQAHRVSKLKEMGVNGWRTAHNPPTPALLDAMDELGMLVWDESHRNGQLDQVPLLIRRDRNHPCVMIWSICNEVLCNTKDSVNDALAMKALMHALDPLSGRPVSANQNAWLGPNTPLDVQGIDYNTGNYDKVHAAAPTIPCISSETSSAVSDRGEYDDNATAGHVEGYDNQYPGWGESAEQAWGGVGMANGQGVLTRAFISGGWTWTGWDYRGEPTPYAWPDVNSHFGILDLAGFEKDRFYWYKSWYTQPAVPIVRILPDNWSWQTGDTKPIWVFSNADEIEVFVNGVSQGRKAMPLYGHVEFDQVPFAPGQLHAVAYKNGTASPVAESFVKTAGPSASLQISIKDAMWGGQLVAGCADAIAVAVAIVDAAGVVNPNAADVVTFTVAGDATYAGASNGDPACLVNNKSPARPAFHGLVAALVLGGTTAGTVTVTASAPGFAPASISIPQVAAPAGWSASWCHTNLAL